MSLQCQDLGLVSNIQRRNLTHEIVFQVDNLFVIEKQEQELGSELPEIDLMYLTLRNGPQN